MLLFFDTETTGFVDTRLPLEHEAQPDLVQLAAILTEHDGTMRNQFAFIVKPDKAIPKAASDVHGIADELASRVGVSRAVAVSLFTILARKADQIIAHNAAFDIEVMTTAAHRAGQTDNWTSLKTPVFCTMKEAAPVVNLPATEKMIAAGIDGPKSPNLGECIKHFFDEELAGAHDALVDVTACKRVYFELARIRQQEETPP